jgi:Protein of unknown function (DUF1761)
VNDLSPLSIGLATVAAFVISFIYYGAFGTQLAQLNPAYADAAAGATPPAWKFAVELLRCLVVALVVAGLAAEMDIAEWTEGLALGFSLWIGFPVVLWTGAVMWEKVPPKLAVLHAGDWLLKLVAVAVIVSL